MRKRVSASVLTVLIAATCCVLNSKRAYAIQDDDAGWTRTKEVFPLNITVGNSCRDSEVVHIEGTALIVTSTRLLDDGTVEIREKDVFEGDGTGTSGARYEFKEPAHLNISTGPNPDGTPFSYTERRTQTLKGAGGVPDQRISYNIHLVIDADGNVTVDIFDTKVDCN